MAETFILISLYTNLPMGVYTSRDNAMEAGWLTKAEPPAWCVVRFVQDSPARTDDNIDNVYEPNDAAKCYSH